MSVNIKTYLANLKKDIEQDQAAIEDENKKYRLGIKAEFVGALSEVVNNSSVTFKQAEFGKKMIDLIFAEDIPPPEDYGECFPSMAGLTIYFNTCKA